LPGSEWLQGKETLWRAPLKWYLVVEQAVSKGLKFLRHDNLSDKGLLDVDEAYLHDLEHSIVLQALLGEHSVHRLVVISWVLGGNLVQLKELWHLALNLEGNVSDDLFAGHPTTRAGSWLDRQHQLKNVSASVLVSDNLSVLVETESLWLWIQWKTLDVVDIVFLGASCNSLVETGFRELVVNLESFFVNESLKNGLDKTHVLVISDTTTVVDFSSKNNQHLEWNGLVHISEDLELTSADIEVLIGEGVWNVPADSTELTSILHNSVEEGKGEDELLELVWLARVVQLLVIERLISLQDVRLET